MVSANFWTDVCQFSLRKRHWFSFLVGNTQEETPTMLCVSINYLANTFFAQLGFQLMTFPGFVSLFYGLQNPNSNWERDCLKLHGKLVAVYS
jgi:hypothetical protein